MSFFEELKRRNVVRVGIAYAVAAWIILQLTDVVGEILELPAWGGKLILLMVVVGFFLALFLAWAFELTPEGVKREKDVDRTQSITRQTGRKLDFAIIALLAFGLGYFIYESRFMERDDGRPSTPLAEQGSVSEEAPDGAIEAAESETPDRRAIAVLPFANRSMNEEDAFFTEGIHDDLLTQLAKISGLKVVSRTSVMQYRDTEKSIPEIAAELGVSAILEGGIQRAGNRVRINAQLIDVNGDQHLWAETFDREMTVENIFDIQSEITQQITLAVRGELNEEERANLARIPTNNLEAYEAYLKAMGLMHQTDYEQENFQMAERWALRAVSLDPDFAQAWAILVEINAQAIWIGYDATPEREAAALEALDNTRRLGPGLPETVAAEAEYAYRIQHNFPAAVLLFREASEALPGDLDLLFRLGVAQRRTTDIAGAEDTFRRAMAIDPNNSRPIAVLVEMLIYTGQLDKAADVLRPAMARFPEVGDFKAYEVQLALARGQAQLAQSLVERLPAQTSNQVVVSQIETPLITGDYQGAIDAWELPGVKAYESNRGFIGNRESSRAWAYALMGAQETARSEARACVERLSGLPPVPDLIRGFEMIYLGHCYLFLDEPELAMRAADEAQAMIPESTDRYFGALVSQQRVLIMARAGKREAALVELERLFSTVFPISKALLQIDHRWDFFRDDERFNDLIRPEEAGS